MLFCMNKIHIEFTFQVQPLDKKYKYNKYKEYYFFIQTKLAGYSALRRLYQQD